MFDVQDEPIRPMDPDTGEVKPGVIPGLIHRVLKLTSGAELTVTNGLAVVKYDVQREQETPGGVQLVRDASRVLLAVPTDKGVAALSFAIHEDGRLAEISPAGVSTSLRSQERQILLPLNLLDNIRGIGAGMPTPSGVIAGMSCSLDNGSADRLQVQVSKPGAAAFQRLKNGDLVKLSSTSSYNGIHTVTGVNADGSFVIDARVQIR